MPNYIFLKQNQIRSKKSRLGAKTLILISFVLMLVAVFVQLFVMSEFATRGDDIAKLEQKRVELTNENLKLNREIAEARNLDYIKKKGEEQGYVAFKLNEVKYVELENR